MVLATFGQRDQISKAVCIDWLPLQDLLQECKKKKILSLLINVLLIIILSKRCTGRFDSCTVCRPWECNTHLHVSAAGHLHKVLLLLQGLVDLVVRHAEAA